MKKINVTAIQMSSMLGDKEKNIQTVARLFNQFIKPETDIVFLPEVWTVGWACEYFINSAETLENSQVINFLSEQAKNYNVNIVGGSFITKNGDKYYNTCPVINRRGELIACYNKCHLFSYYGDTEGTYITEGNNPVMVNIEGIKIGLSICYDIRFPELYRAYRKAGADILVNMAAWGASKKIPWDSMTTSRAVENQTYFIALTQTGTLKNGEKNLGHSMILDYKGDILSEINKKEDGIYAVVDLEAMYEFRKKCTVLNDIKKSYEVEIK